MSDVVETTTAPQEATEEQSAEKSGLSTAARRRTKANRARHSKRYLMLEKGLPKDHLYEPNEALAQIKELATLPSREELIAKLLFLLQSPITRFVRVLAAVPQQFVGVLDQIRVQKEKQGS